MVALNPNFDTTGAIESFVMYRLIGNKTQDFQENMNLCFAFSFFLRIFRVLYRSGCNSIFAYAAIVSGVAV